jgi:NAD(P)-dependent dehydrogenase (short-subunit alcohol dehydrogenase family)
MKKQKNKQKNFLLIGGTSSLSNNIISLAKKDKYFIYATYKNKNKITYNNDTQWLELDISSQESVLSFLKNTPNNFYDKVIFLIGKTTKNKYDKINIFELEKYYTEQASNYIYLLQSILLKTKKTSKIIVVTSRAANHGSYDVHYSAVKGAIQSAVKSLAKFKNNKTIFCVAPSLMLDSKMFKEMSSKNISKHLKRTNNKLLTKDEVALFIWNSCDTSLINLNGKVLEIGRDLP